MTADSSPLVSVVVTTYFRNDLVREALDSVFEQTYESIEVILVDDSAERHAEPVADEYDLTYVGLESNHGPHAARDAGVDYVNGEYVQFLDDDDALKPSKIEAQVELFEAVDDSVGVVYCGYEYFDERQRIMPSEAMRGDVLDRALQSRMDPACTPTMMYRRSVLESIRPFKNTHGADIIGFLIELAQVTEFDFVDDDLVWVRRNDEHESYSAPPTVTDGLREMMELYEHLYERTDPENYRCFMGRYHRRRMEELLSLHVWSPAAVYHAGAAVKYSPDWKSLVTAGLAVFGRYGLRLGRKGFSAVSGGEQEYTVRG